jgi:hypothetical protein
VDAKYSFDYIGISADKFKSAVFYLPGFLKRGFSLISAFGNKE